jgi:hypothetical protein
MMGLLGRPVPTDFGLEPSESSRKAFLGHGASVSTSAKRARENLSHPAVALEAGQYGATSEGCSGSGAL